MKILFTEVLAMNVGPGDDVVVVGAGLAGLAAAAFLARDGFAVTVLERAGTPGGRAVTHWRDGFHLNLGPHALYRGGAGARVLAELGVGWHGGTPSVSGAFALDRGRRHALPGGLVSLVTTGLFGPSAKVETARFLASLGGLDVSTLHDEPVRAWIDRHVRHPDVRRLLEALLRLATYVEAPERLSAGLALGQLQGGLKSNVAYLDGGWQALVDGLRTRAVEAGARLRTGAAAVALETNGNGVRAVQLRNGSAIPARAVVLALPADDALPLLPDGPARWSASAAEAVRAACLDVALARLPRPRTRFALGIDRPLYCSVHSAYADLAPTRGAVVHVACYLGDEPPAPRLIEHELEGVLDLLQPGWRDVVVERRFLPSMTVASALATAAGGGLPGRPGAAVPECPNLALAGDWIGPTGWLADASLASAREAAHLTATRLRSAAAAAA